MHDSRFPKLFFRGWFSNDEEEEDSAVTAGAPTGVFGDVFAGPWGFQTQNGVTPFAAK
jgi:hypothetical protein